MKIKENSNILEIIGAVLIVVALLSAYGLFYTGNQYAKVVETQTTTTATITGVAATTEGENIRLRFTGVVDNPGRLDIDVTVVEIRISLYDGRYLDGLGLGTTIGDAVLAGDTYEFIVNYVYDADKFLEYADDSGSFLLVFDGEANFIISGGSTIYEAPIPWNGQVVMIDG